MLARRGLLYVYDLYERAIELSGFRSIPQSDAFVYPWFHVNFERAKRIVDLFQVVLLFSSSSPSILRMLKLHGFGSLRVTCDNAGAASTG